MLSPIKNSNNEPSAGRKPIGVDHGVKRSRRGRKAAFCRQWRSDGLTRTIEDRVLPKLALAHRHDAAGGPDTAPGAAELLAVNVSVLPVAFASGVFVLKNHW